MSVLASPRASHTRTHHAATPRARSWWWWWRIRRPAPLTRPLARLPPTAIQTLRCALPASVTYQIVESIPLGMELTQNTSIYEALYALIHNAKKSVDIVSGRRRAGWDAR